MYKTQILEKEIDFVNVFPDIQEYIRNENPTKRFDFGLIDVVEFLRNDTDDWSTEKQEAVNIDNAIYRIVTNFSKTEKGKEMGVDKVIDDINDGIATEDNEKPPQKETKKEPPKELSGENTETAKQKKRKNIESKIKGFEISLKYLSGDKKAEYEKKIIGFKIALKYIN